MQYSYSVFRGKRNTTKGYDLIAHLKQAILFKKKKSFHFRMEVVSHSLVPEVISLGRLWQSVAFTLYLHWVMTLAT